MHTRSRTTALLTTALLAVSLAACEDEPAGPVEQQVTTTFTGDEPLADDEVTQHLLDTPELPGPLEGATITRSELRHPELLERHIVELVDVPAGATVALDETMIAGAVVRVPEGATLTVGTAADVARLDGDTVTEVQSGCPAPCEVAGPALVAPDGWMAGFTVAPDWLLLVPAPL